MSLFTVISYSLDFYALICIILVVGSIGNLETWVVESNQTLVNWSFFANWNAICFISAHCCSRNGSSPSSQVLQVYL